MAAAGGADSIPAIPDRDPLRGFASNARRSLRQPDLASSRNHPGWPCMGLDAGEAALRER